MRRGPEDLRRTSRVMRSARAVAEEQIPVRSGDGRSIGGPWPAREQLLRHLRDVMTIAFSAERAVREGRMSPQEEQGCYRVGRKA